MCYILTNNSGAAKIKIKSIYYNFIYSIHPRKPLLIWRIIKNYLAIIFKKAVLLRYIDACIELKCNLECEHCFAVNFEDKTKTPISDEEWVDIFDQCRELGNLAVAFTGGEPLLNPRLEDLINKSKPSETLIVVCTNGTILTAEKAKSLYRAGVDVVQISLDSLRPEEHNLFRRNKEAFQKTMEGIKNALAAGIRVTIVTVVSHFSINSQGFLELLEWAHRKNLMVNLALATPVGRWNNKKEVLLTEEDFRVLDRLTLRYPNARRDFETNYLPIGCGAAKEKLYFTPFGDVLPCPYMHISFGNIKKMRVAEIRKNMFSIKELNRYHPKCLMAQDRNFIEGPLSIELNENSNKVVDWKKVFDKSNNS